MVYIHPFNGYRDLNSYMKRLAINANGNTITSFAGELNPTWIEEYLSIYLSIYLYIYIYIYIYVCILDIYISNSWNLDCDPRVSWSFLQNNNHQAVNKMK